MPGDTPKVVSRASTPAPQAEGSSSESIAADDALLRQCAAVIADVKSLETQTWALWRNETSQMLEPLFTDEETSTEHVQGEGAFSFSFFSFF